MSAITKNSKYMKNRKIGWILILGLASIPTVARADTSLLIEFPNEFFGFFWSDDSIWDNGSPTTDCDVTINEQFDFFTGETLDVDVQVDVPTTIENFTMDTPFVDLLVEDNFSVTGTTTIESGSVVVFGKTASLGTLAAYDSATDTLGSGGSFVVRENLAGNVGILEFRDADIRVNDAGIVLFGTNTILRDQNTGLDAFRFFEENNGALQLDDGRQFSVSGNLLNNGNIFMGFIPTARSPRLDVAGNLTNDGKIEINGNSVVNVAGSYTGSGDLIVGGANNQISITQNYNQTGGKVNLGSGIDGLLLKAVAQFYTGGACVVGSGGLEGDITFSNGTLAPGNSPGKIDVSGDLTLGTAAILEIEIGGTEAGINYDQVAQEGGAAGVALDGALSLAVIDDFECDMLVTDSFTIVRSDLPVTGAFANVASGARLDTSDGLGSFLVEYGPGTADPNAVVISDFVANITSQSFGDWTTANAVPAGEDGLLDDPNDDGILNIEAFFRGIAPIGDATPTRMEAIAIAGGGVQAVIESPKSVFGVVVSSMISTDLVNWSPGPEPAIVSETVTKNLYGVTLPTDDRYFVKFVFQELAIGE